MKVIAFAGLGQAGKTTAVDEICQWCMEKDGKFFPVRLSFAGPLKEAMALMGARKGGRKDALYRKGCQLIGDTFRDQEFVPGVTKPDYWVNLMHDRFCTETLSESDRLTIDAGKCWRETLVLIDDVRFINEIRLIQEDWDGKVIFIDGYRRLKKDMGAEWRQHSSEQLATQYTMGNLDDETMDYTVTNNSNEADFRRGLRMLTPLWAGLRADT
jgi:hypothetical protein